MNNWTIVEKFVQQLKSGRLRSMYLIQCKCGSQRKIFTSDWKHLENGTISKTTRNLNQMCQKCMDKESREKKISECSIEKAYKHLHMANESGAKRSGKEFTLTLEQSSEMYKSNCYYCGKEPSNKVKLNTGNIYLYSGIDRIDSKRGYSPDNTRSCCVNCNKAKMDMSEEQFFELCFNVTALRLQRLSQKCEYIQVNGNEENPISNRKG